jgi:hypothetical protein
VSARVQFNQAIFTVDRKTFTGWTRVPGASFTCTTSYDVHDNSEGLPPSPIPTLVYGTEVASITLSFHGPATGESFFVGDEIRALLGGSIVVFHGTIESRTVTTTADPEMARSGHTIRTDVEYHASGYYADLMGRTISWGTETLADGTVVVHGPALPQELWETRIRRWVGVTHE